MRRFYAGLPKKSDYRRFKLHTTEGKPDDFLSMREVTPTALTKAKMAFDYRVLDAETGRVLVLGHTQNVYTSRETGHIERLSDKYWIPLKAAMAKEKALKAAKAEASAQQQ